MSSWFEIEGEDEENVSLVWESQGGLSIYNVGGRAKKHMEHVR